MRIHPEPEASSLVAIERFGWKERLVRSWQAWRLGRRERLTVGVAKRYVAILLLGTGAGVLAIATTHAQATPAAAPAIEIVGDPVNCTVSPRPLEDFFQVDVDSTDGLKTMQGTPIATPAPPTGGVPADPETVAAITATVNEMTACLNAGDLRRLAALLTDEQFRRLYGGVGAEVITSELGTPVPLPAEAQVTGLMLSEILVYPDGRVSAVATYNGITTRTIFIRAGDRYLADISYPLTGTTEAMATPAE